MKALNLGIILCTILLVSCNDTANDELNDGVNLIIKFKFDPDQERLDNLGQPSSIPAGNAAQSPNVNRMSANYIELAPNAFTPLGFGEIVYEGAETNAGGGQAIDFQNAEFAGNDQTFLSIPLQDVTPGNYSWVRISLAYQEGEIDLLVNGAEDVS